MKGQLYVIITDGQLDSIQSTKSQVNQKLKFWGFDNYQIQQIMNGQNDMIKVYKQQIQNFE